MPLVNQEEEKPFLSVYDGDGTESLNTPKDGNRISQNLSFKIHSILFAFQIAFLITNISLLIQNITPRLCRVGQGLDNAILEKTFTPAEVAVEYNVQEINYEQDFDLFAGKPRPELDLAWSQLLKSSMLKISEDEMRQMNKTSISLRDGSGYIGYLESLHMLHCVKRIYQFQYPDYYPDIQDENEYAFSNAHMDHCLAVLRQGIMCNADLTVNTYFWESSKRIRGDRSGHRKCMNWERIQAWAEERSLAARDRDSFIATLVPSDEAGTLGPVY
ncbi:uncharacterized protein F4807DRAFT_449050 [Annulohypoxylon truncatum]|uniref:uncharacterized protein n=1 Tax=Annulohypoxylon truncatum TaxID=327061 RepID=UPI002007C402|nr:uncharacterized protein F4807DRAFT_449050 [Annulohypoxylon truncatum]KAI1204065.1 hypothetical protein F4807DRAFT_449050 [Annulohypoxylon truncatum]